ncbi:hypothetical protein SDC9_113363 [bioreactor metagenome]|uniref:Uncharacterized protein n=1 Tax=bioreactor metagenome TaxID=1076179 RepID=A0A645BM71_9ZZZZ
MHPGVPMHAVGDRSDRHLADVESGPQRLEHLPTDLTVQLGHAIGSLAQPQAHHRHVEPRRISTREVLRPQAQNAIDWQRSERTELRTHLVHAEAVDAGRHRGVSGVEHAGADLLHRRIEGFVLVGHPLADALQAHEDRVTLVGVEDDRRGVAGDTTELADGPHAADAQQHFLRKSVVGAAAVQLVGDQPFALVVDLQVGVHQHQRDASHAGDPQLRMDEQALDVDLDHHRRAIGVGQQGDRQLVRVQQRVTLLLPAGGVERLDEVAVVVEQTDTDQRHTQVGGRLEMIAGQDSQATRVLRQDLGDTELGREVADCLRGLGVVGGPGLVPALAGEVLGEVVADQFEITDEAAVTRKHVQPFGADLREHLKRIAAGAHP